MMDYWLEQLINGLAGRDPTLDSAMVAIAAWSELAFIALVAGWLLAGILFRSRGERDQAFLALLASGVALGANQILGHVWDRPRPFAAHPGQVHLLLPHAADSSFPSDHVAAAVAIAIVLAVAHRRLGGLMLLVSVLVGFARVYVGDHYPGDVLAGTAVGIAAASFVLRTARIRIVATAILDRVLVLMRVQPG